MFRPVGEAAARREARCAQLEGETEAWAALRQARDQGMNYEKLRTLARLPDADIPAWIPRARMLTVIALRREVEDQVERQMSAAGAIGAVMPEPAAEVLSTAIETARNLAGCLLPAGCLAFIAWHFLQVWGPQVKGPKTLSQKARRRDGGWCLVPGCSHAAMHAHHGRPRGQGGPDELWNLLSLCIFHHLRCIHEGWLRVYGRAPDALRWELAGRPRLPWTGGTEG